MIVVYAGNFTFDNEVSFLGFRTIPVLNSIRLQDYQLRCIWDDEK